MGERWNIPPAWAHQVTRAAIAVDTFLCVGTSPNSVVKTGQESVRVNWCGIPHIIDRDTATKAIRAISKSLELAYWDLDVESGKLCIEATPILPGLSGSISLRTNLDIPPYQPVPTSQTSTIDAPVGCAVEFNAALDVVGAELKETATPHFIRVVARMMAVCSRLCANRNFAEKDVTVDFKTAAATNGRSTSVSIDIGPIKAVQGEKIVEVMAGNPWWSFTVSSLSKRIVFTIGIPVKGHS